MYQVENSADCVVITPQNDIVASNAQELRQTVFNHIEKVESELIVNFQNVEVIDSSGIGVLIATQNSLKEVDKKLKVSNLSDDIFNLFKMMNLNNHFVVEEPNS